MRKLLIACVALVAFASCSKTPQQVAEGVIKAYISENMKDLKGYSPISFGTIDSAFTSLESCPEYAALEQQVEAAAPIVDSLNQVLTNELPEEQKTAVEAALAAVSEAGNKLTQMQNDFKSEFTGFELTHKFNTEAGEQEMTFVLDKDLTKVVGAK